MIVSILAAVIFLGSGYWVYWRQRRTGIKSLPGPKPWPIVGNAHQVDKKKLHVTLNQWAHEYGDIFGFDMLGNKYLVLNNLELFESVLTKFTNRPYSVMSVINYNGNGVDYTNNAFLVEEMKRVAHDIAEDKEMHALFKGEVKAVLDEIKSSGGNDVDLNTALLKATTTHMMLFVLGCMPDKANIEAFGKLIEKVGTFFGGTTNVILTALPWLRFIPGPLKRQYGDCKIEMEDMIEGLVDIIRNGKGNGRGMLENMMTRKQELENNANEKERLMDENIYAFVVDVLLGSIRPMFKNMVSIILCILKHQSVQDKLHDELDSVCPNKPPTETDRSQLHYLNATLLEGLRYMSILTLTLPHTNTEDAEINGYFVRKGTQILGSMFNLHHAESTWGDGWKFRPERFLDLSGNLLPSDHPLRRSVKPFGTGMRMCKGYNIAEPAMFMYISNILYYFNVLPPVDGVLPECDSRTYGFAPALIVPDVRCRFELRQKKE